MTKRTKRLRRIVLNKLARRLRHRETRAQKKLRLNPRLLPFIDEQEHAYDGENWVGPVAFYRVDAKSHEETKRFWGDETWTSLKELRALLKHSKETTTRNPIVRFIPEGFVMTNWDSRLVPLADIAHRIRI